LAWIVELAGPARADIRSVLAWTTREFSTLQRRRYRGLIDSAVFRLAEGGPLLPGSQAVSPDHPAQRRIALPGRASHMFVYRQSAPGRILVLRLLHAGQDTPRHLPD
jgi:plasmid stabilization system protein ParE